MNKRQFEVTVASITRITVEADDEAGGANHVAAFLSQPYNGGQLCNVAPGMLFQTIVYDIPNAARLYEVGDPGEPPIESALPGQMPLPFPYTRPELVTV